MKSLLIIVTLVSCWMFDDSKTEVEQSNFKLPDGFVVEACECQFTRPDRKGEEMFGIVYPAILPYEESFAVSGKFRIQGHWAEDAIREDKTSRQVKIPIEFEFAPLGLESSPELLKTLRTEKKFPWDKWGLDDRLEPVTKEPAEKDSEKQNREEIKPKVVRFQLPKEKDFFGSERETRGGFRTVRYELEFELPNQVKVNEVVPFRFVFDQEKPLIACCYYRIGVKTPQEVLTTRAAVLYHGSKVSQTYRELDQEAKDLLKRLGLPDGESEEDKE